MLMEDDELAFKLVELYVKEVSATHEKRQMGLDTILNAYFYALLRITRKKEEILAMKRAVEASSRTPASVPAPKGTVEAPEEVKGEARPKIAGEGEDITFEFD